MMAPEIANQDKRIDGIILLAAPARHLEDLILEQYNYIFGLDGEIDENEAEQIATLEEQIEKIKTLNISKGDLIINAPLAYWEYLADYNQVSTAENLTIPMLILQGERDYQVTMEGDYVKWENTFFNNENVTLRSYEFLNHLFISGSGPTYPQSLHSHFDRSCGKTHPILFDPHLGQNFIILHLYLYSYPH